MNPSNDHNLQEQYQRLWAQSGESLPNLSQFLKNQTSASLQDVASVVLIDQHFRWRRGIEPRSVEFYLEQFPQLALAQEFKLELITEEYGYYRQYGMTLVPADFLRRFPDLDPRRLELSEPALTETHSRLQSPGSDTHIGRKPSGHTTDVAGTFGDYELFEQLGRGGMGVVYRARQRSANRIVALKLIRADRLPDSTAEKTEALARFQREAQLTAQLDTEHVVTVYEVGQNEGRPFYSMKYVEGQSLHDLLREGPLENRRAARYVQSIARGVHEAHQHGILHRDLKPHNALVESKSDRAMVADFGLAKLVEGDGALSVSGDVFGTPSYMSPEQTRDSSKVTPLSDVYSLGATLYHALTGRPPFQAATALATLEQVTQSEPLAPRQLNAAVNRDLETICLKAIAKEPTRRYGSAAEMADELRRYLNGEPIHARPVGSAERAWRWCRRNRAVAGLMAAVASALVIGTAVSSFFAISATRERDRADINANDAKSRAEEASFERDRATASFRKAQQAVDDSFTAISENKLLNVPGMQPLRKELMQSALRYYEGFLKDRAKDPKLRGELAKTHHRVASIRQNIGEVAEAEQAYLRAIEIEEQLAHENPTATMYQDDLASSFNNLGTLQSLTGRAEEAEKSFSRAIEIQETLARQNPNEPKYQDTLGTCLTNLANLRRDMNHQAEAEKGYSRAIEILEKLSRDHPNVPAYQGNFASSLNSLAQLQRSIGRNAEAEKSYLQAIEIGEKLARENRTTPDYQDNLARSLSSLAILQGATGRGAAAEQSYLRVIEINEKLARENPAVPGYQRGLANSLNNLANLQCAMGQLASGEKSFLRAIEILESLARNYPEVPNYQVGLANSLSNLANVQSATGRGAEAEKSYLRAIEIKEKVAAENPNEPGYLNGLASSLSNLGMLQSDLGRDADAENTYRRTIEIKEKLVLVNPAVPEYKAELARIFTNLGILQSRTDRKEAAEKSYARAVELGEALVLENPNVSGYKRELAASFNNLGMLQSDLDRNSEAENSYLRAIEIKERLAHANPNALTAQYDLANSLHNLAVLRRDVGRQAEAKALIEKSGGIFRSLCDADPKNSAYRVSLQESRKVAASLDASKHTDGAQQANDESPQD